MKTTIAHAPARRRVGRPHVGTVYPHRDHFDVRITWPDGTRSTPIHLNDPPITDRAEAVRIAAEWSAMAARGEIVRDGTAPVKAPATLAEIAPRWVELVKTSELAPSTKALHGIAARVVADRFGTLTPAQLTAPVVRAWVRELRGALSASRTRNIFNSLGKLLDDAFAEGWHQAPNPCRLPKVREELPALPDLEDGDKPRHTEDEASRLCFDARIPLERRLRYLLAFTTGMRDGELAGLRWSSLVVEHQVEAVRVRDAVAQAGDAGWATRRATKTKASRRTIPLHPAALAALAGWRAGGWRELVGRDPTDDDPILPGPGGEPARPASAALLRADLATVGLPTSWRAPGGAEEPFEFRSTRRSFATWLEAHEVSGDHVDRLLGHAPTSVRRKHYSAGDLRALARAVATIRIARTDQVVIGADNLGGASSRGVGGDGFRQVPSAAAGAAAGGAVASARKLRRGGGRHAGAALGLQSRDGAHVAAESRERAQAPNGSTDATTRKNSGKKRPLSEPDGTGGALLEVARHQAAGAFRFAYAVIGGRS